jgi:hypothetical protein
MIPYNFTIGSYIVAEASLEANSIFGTGYADYSILILPMQLDLRYPYKQAGSAIELCCRVASANSGYITPVIFTPMQFRASAEHLHLKNNTVHLEIPLDRERIAALERDRRGDDLQLRLDCELLADELVELAKTQAPYPAPVWGIREHHSMHSQIPLVIPRDVWVKRVLPGVGFGVVRVIELPAVTVEACNALKHSYDALRQAQEWHLIRLYDDAVGKCRVALDPFFELTEKIDEKGGKSRAPTLKKVGEGEIRQSHL